MPGALDDVESSAWQRFGISVDFFRRAFFQSALVTG
jgi:hypothetical protein